jgi:COP9 signalosome complex subunit 7
MKALSISNPAELESLVTTAIYNSLITARLSPATNPPTVHVSSVAPLRDVRPQTVSTMISILSEWEGRCGGVIGGIEAEIAKIKAQAAKNRERERDRASRLERSIAGWEGDGADDGVGGAETTAGRTLGRSNLHSSSSAGGAKFGPASGNKREFSGDVDDDDGYWDNGSDGGVEASGSRMDIDEGAGAYPATSNARAGGAGPGGSSTRQAKRILNMGKKG